MSIDLSTVLSAHEDRIQELESNSTTLLVDFTRFSNDFDHLKSTIDEQFLPGLHKIQSGLNIHRDESKNRMDENKAQMLEISGRLGGLELIKKAKADTRLLWKSRAIGVAMAAGGTTFGVLCSKFGGVLWDMIVGGM
jgi:hypothetical protein